MCLYLWGGIMARDKKTVSQLVTEKIMAKLQQGNIPWIRGWNTEAPINWVTQKRYTGINRWLLDSGEYLTFKQIENAGGKLKKGSHGNLIVYYTEYKSKKKDTANKNKAINEKISEEVVEVKESKTDDCIIRKVLRYYYVYNVLDVEGISPRRKRVKHKELVFKEEKAKELSTEYLTREHIGITYTGSRAFYTPMRDTITLPNIESFYNKAHYYSTLFHEMGHSTGAAKRLCRKGVPMQGIVFGSPTYAEEELIAECVSAQLGAEVGIDAESFINNNAAYIQSWLKTLNNDTNLVLSAAAKAEQAVKYIKGEESI